MPRPPLNPGRAIIAGVEFDLKTTPVAFGVLRTWPSLRLHPRKAPERLRFQRRRLSSQALKAYLSLLSEPSGNGGAPATAGDGARAPLSQLSPSSTTAERGRAKHSRLTERPACARARTQDASHGARRSQRSPQSAVRSHIEERRFVRREAHRRWRKGHGKGKERRAQRRIHGFE